MACAVFSQTRRLIISHTLGSLSHMPGFRLLFSFSERHLSLNKSPEQRNWLLQDNWRCGGHSSPAQTQRTRETSAVRGGSSQAGGTGAKEGRWSLKTLLMKELSNYPFPPTVLRPLPAVTQQHLIRAFDCGARAERVADPLDTPGRERNWGNPAAGGSGARGGHRLQACSGQGDRAGTPCLQGRQAAPVGTAAL